MPEFTVLNLKGCSQAELQFGLDILALLMKEAELQKYSSQIILNEQGLLKSIKLINPVIPYHIVHEMLVILQHEILNEKTGKANNPNRCDDCADFEALSVTVFKKISGSCSDGPDIPCASDPACAHFKKKELVHYVPLGNINLYFPNGVIKSKEDI